VDRRSHCGNKQHPAEQRAAMIKENVLSEDDGITSVFYVTNARDMARAALALNFFRTGGLRVEELCLLALKPDELDGVPMEQTTDSFACHWARLNHWNVTLTSPDQERIAHLLANRERFPGKFTRFMMQGASDDARQDGCRSVNANSTHCICEGE